MSGSPTFTGSSPVSTWASLRHVDFRRFFLAAAISNVGTWMQAIAVPFAIYEITSSEAWLGATGFLNMILGTIANTPGGVLADRVSRRVLLAVTVALQMASATALWVLFAAGQASIVTLVPVVALGAAAAGLTSPAWSSLLPSLVPPDDFQGALRLNSMQYAVGRAIGPMLGAVTLKLFGPTACFAINAVTFPLIIAAVLLTPKQRARATAPLTLASATRDVVAGWRYLGTSSTLLYPPLATLVIAGFGFGLTTLAPALADVKLGRAADDNGLLIAAFGIGGVIGVLSTARLSRRSRPGLQIGWAFGCWAAATMLLAATGSFGVGVGAMAAMGVAHGIGGITLTTVMQSATDDAFRGRVMANYVQMFFLGSAIGSLVLGMVADRVSLSAAAATSSAAFTLWLVISVTRFDRLRVLDVRTPPSGPEPRRPAPEPDAVPAVGTVR